MTKFSTGEGKDRNDKHVGDRYFLESGDKIRYFFEEDAIQDGKLVKEKEKAVNKCGHGESSLVSALGFNRGSVGKAILLLSSREVCRGKPYWLVRMQRHGSDKEAHSFLIFCLIYPTLSALHALDPVFNQFSFSQRIQNLAKSLDVHSDPRVLQSMIVSELRNF